MYIDVPLWLSILFVVVGLFFVAKSANLFIDSASAVATALGVNPFVIGMVVIGFGTSAPELCVSALSGISGHSDMSLGNAYGSCSFNIALILGVATVIRPLVVKPSVSFVAVPMLLGITVFSCLLVGYGDGNFSRTEGLLSLGVFAVLLPLYCWYDRELGEKNRERRKRRMLNQGTAKEEPEKKGRGLGWSFMLLMLGLGGLVGSSHVLVWGAVDLARAIGVSELLIGLTIIAAGTSLPELASAVVSARRGEHDFVLGNIIGSNLFNTLAVVGLAGSISPFKNVSPYILTRDLPTLLLLSFSIAIFGLNFRNFRRPGRINRLEGALWVVSFAVYLGIMLYQECR